MSISNTRSNGAHFTGKGQGGGASTWSAEVLALTDPARKARHTDVASLILTAVKDLPPIL